MRIEIAVGALPLAQGVSEVAGELGKEPSAFAATAGEDYELCVCIPPHARALADDAVTWIGEVREGAAGLVFIGARHQALAGFEHAL